VQGHQHPDCAHHSPHRSTRLQTLWRSLPSANAHSIDSIYESSYPGPVLSTDAKTDLGAFEVAHEDPNGPTIVAFTDKQALYLSANERPNCLTDSYTYRSSINSVHPSGSEGKDSEHANGETAAQKAAQTNSAALSGSDQGSYNSHTYARTNTGPNQTTYKRPIVPFTDIPPNKSTHSDSDTLTHNSSPDAFALSCSNSEAYPRTDSQPVHHALAEAILSAHCPPESFTHPYSNQPSSHADT
jgi:hypothetical protein